MSTPRLGQAFVSPFTADHPVEWVVVAEPDAAAQAVLVVPADTSPAVGSADVAVSPAEAGAPLVLRGRFALWVRPGLFEPKLMTRTIPTEACRAVAAKHQAFLVGQLAGETLELETDEDFEYRQWLKLEVEPAHRALAAAQASFVAGEAAAETASRSAAPSRFPWAPALAASLGTVGLGLGLWALVLRQQVEQLSGPLVNLAMAEVNLGDTPRGVLEIELPAGSDHFFLSLQLDSKARRFERFRLVVVNPSRQQPVETEDLKQLPGGELTVVLKAPRNPGEILNLTILGLGTGPPTDLGSHKLTFSRRPPS